MLALSVAVSMASAVDVGATPLTQLRAEALAELTASKGERLTQLLGKLTQEIRKHQTRPRTAFAAMVIAWRDGGRRSQLPFVASPDCEVARLQAAALQAHLLNLPPPVASL